MTIRPQDQPTNRPADDLDPLRHIEGFPIGEDEDLHALSDPPHYTAYPQPPPARDIARWQTERAHLRAALDLPEQMLYSKMLAYYIQHGYEITLNADRFYRLLGDHFLERDGYWFCDEQQVQEYERRKLIPETTKGRRGRKAAPLAQRVLFISDERSAIAWLHGFLETPRDCTEIYTEFVKALQVPEDQIPEIKTLLEENFVQVNGKYKRPD